MKLYGEEDNDTIYGGLNNDFIYGGQGDDKLYGEGGLDAVLGEDGNDYLSGGADGIGDVLSGGLGADIFVMDLYGAGEVKKNKDKPSFFNANEGDKFV